MRGTVLFAIVAIVCYQHAYSQEIGSENKATQNPVSVTTEANLQTWGDVKEHHKHVTSNAWNSMKEFARTTKEKIHEWAEHIKNHEKEVRRSFQEHVEKMKADFKIVIQNIIKTAKYNKQCLQSDKPAIDEVLKRIVRDAVHCMAEHLKRFLPFGDDKYEVLAKDTKFTDETENKLNLCLKNTNVEECMQKVRKEAFDGMDNTENGIIKTRMDTRNIADDILTNITFCSAKGVMDASNAIAKEIERIIACVKEAEIH